MKLKEGPIFNLGDTSFRRKTLLEDYKVLLPILKDLKDEFQEWNNEIQKLFYKNVLKSDLFSRNEKKNLDRRGRNLVNSLFKLGLVNQEGILGEAALNWMSNNSKNMDDIEILLNLSIDNVVFLRQLMKLRIYDKLSDNFFYPFRVAIYFISCYPNVEEKNFLKILHLIKPSMNERKIKKVIDNYEEVNSNNLEFKKFIENNFLINNNKEIKKAKKIFSNEKINFHEFKEIFPNRKTKKSQERYYKFYLAVQNYKKNKNVNSLEKLIEISKEPVIKKAFGFNRNIFDLPNQRNFSVQSFERLNKKNLILGDDKLNFYFQFKQSKLEDNIREYSDITKRAFNLSGIFIFNNGLVNLHQSELFTILIDISKSNFSLSGTDFYEDYEKKINSPFYQDLTFLDITKTTKNELKLIIGKLQDKYNIHDISKLSQFFESEKDRKFNEFVEKEFTCEKTLKILELFKNHIKNDKIIKSLVSDSTTVYTIFEYIIAIAWYYISDKQFSIKESLNLTLDGNFKPLSHARGGDGDIIINYSNLTLMIEATLMNPNAQKRGELEPVIRHTVNLTSSNENEVITIFIANELDNNVINLFKVAQFVELESSDKMKNKVNGIKIFSMSIDDIIKLLIKNIAHEKIIEIISNEYNNFRIPVKIGWSEDIIEKFFESFNYDSKDI